MDVSDAALEPRFEFGKNWSAFLDSVDERRIQAACDSMVSMLAVDRLDGLTFLDVGCGSGLSSLAAVRLGATVHSFDYDEQCVACTNELKSRFADGSATWRIEQGSVLDATYLESLRTFDLVYSWGVLHHTGEMRKAIDLVADRVIEGGLLFIAIYHDQGGASRRWATIKRTYQRLPGSAKPAFVAAIASIYEAKFAVSRLARGKNPLPFEDWKRKADDRGMSAWYDWVDWVGGWPFEVATPSQITELMVAKRFKLQKLKTVGNGWGCNEFVFRRTKSNKDGRSRMS